MRRAIIENGVVTNIIVSEDPDHGVDIGGEAIAIGDLFDGSHFTKQVPAPYDPTQYRALRAFAYPPQADYLDAIVKGDTAQQAAYIAACKAVKERYPKP